MPQETPNTRDNYRDLLNRGGQGHMPVLAGEVAELSRGRLPTANTVPEIVAACVIVGVFIFAVAAVVRLLFIR